MSEIEIIERKRYYWIDHARGFIMILLVLTEFLPQIIRTSARFFLEHPENQTTTTTMNFYDIGAPAFILIMGLLMPLSFSRRKEKSGVRKAILHLAIRYIILLVLGYLVIIIDQGGVVKLVDGVPIVIWDVLPTLGLVGLLTIPFLFFNIRVRAIVASSMLLFYQIMLIYGGWRWYAIESVHGGIFGTIFGFASLMIFATCFGELLLLNKTFEQKKKYLFYAIFGVICFVGGLLLAFIPEWYPNKRQVTLTYIMISMGASILLSFLFIALDKVVKKPIFILDSYGKNPFLLYVIAIVLEFLIADIIGLEMDFIIFTLMVIVITIIAIGLDKWGKVIKL